MVTHRALAPATPWVEISATQEDWDEVTPVLLTDLGQAQDNEVAFAAMKAPLFDRDPVRKAYASIEKVRWLYQPVY